MSGKFEALSTGFEQGLAPLQDAAAGELALRPRRFVFASTNPASSAAFLARYVSPPGLHQGPQVS